MVVTRRLVRAFKICVAGMLPWTTVDRVPVSEIFVNLLSNALKYNDMPVCRIEIGCDSATKPPAGSAGRPMFYAKDNGMGIGIATNPLEQIFKMFRRLHGRDDCGGRTGTGRTIVKKSIEGHGGEMWVKSAPGQRATSYFTLAADLAAPMIAFA